MFLNPISQVVDTIVLASVCQKVIDDLNEAISDIQFKKLDNERKSKRAIEISATVESQLTAAQSTLTSYNAIIAGLPAGSPVLPTFQDEKTKLEFRVFTLSKRLETVGKTALIVYALENDSLSVKEAEYQNVRNAAVTKLSTL